jgi:hypothetical protein
MFLQASNESAGWPRARRIAHRFASVRVLARARHLVSSEAPTHSIMRKSFNFFIAGVIRLRCSRSPRALHMTTPLTHDWRAAWRRSVRRKPRRRRAQGRPSAARRSNHALACQSSTSNDVDDCVKRAGEDRRAASASQSHFGRAGSSRRQRASAGAGLERHRPVPIGQGGEDEGGSDPFLTVGSASCPRAQAPAIPPTPSVRLVRAG